MPFRAVLAAVLILLAIPHASATERGIASWYGPAHHNELMANGRRFNQWGATIAHKTLPLGTEVRIRNTHNGRIAQATVTDRGPYKAGRKFDVSRNVARILQMEDSGLAVVEVEIVKLPKRRRT